MLTSVKPDIVGRGRPSADEGGRRTEADGGPSFFSESRPPQGRTRTADLEISTEPDGSGPKIQADRPPQGRKRTADRDFFVQSGPKRTEADGPPMMGISVIKIHHLRVLENVTINLETLL